MIIKGMPRQTAAKTKVMPMKEGTKPTPFLFHRLKLFENSANGEERRCKTDPDEGDADVSRFQIEAPELERRIGNSLVEDRVNASANTDEGKNPENSDNEKEQRHRSGGVTV